MSAEAAVPLDPGPGSPARPVEARRPHVVVIDDERDLCELLTLRLEHHGFRTSTEQTGRGGIEILEREVVDAVILDLRLEDASGLDVLEELQKRSADLPVIILTAHGTIETAVEAMRRGAYGFLTKPFDDHELVQKLQHAVEHVRMRRELANLRRLVGAPESNEQLLGTSARIAAVRELLQRVARSDATVLITGESGSGKEVAARMVHAWSGRRDRPFLAVNCGALPGELLESELFGHVRGSFTGALKDKEGLFSAAEGGTLMLDEIGDAPPSVQVKLLRVLQERNFLRVGSVEPVQSDVRVIAATNKDLKAEVDAGRFREDLFYRLHVVPVVMPALRERPEDIPLLAELFLTRAAAAHGLSGAHLSSEALRLLMAHSWPGNVRELANVVAGAALLTTDGVLRPAHVAAVMAQRTPAAVEAPVAGSDVPAPLHRAVLSTMTELPPLREAREAFDRAYLEELLRQCNGNVSAAARMAGRNRTDLHDLLKRHDISATWFRK